MTIPFRCDSPTCRRHMELVVRSLSEGELDIFSSIVEEEDRPYAALLDPNVARSDSFLTICSWCKRVRLPSDGWTEVEIAIRCLNLFHAGPLPNLSHGVCDECLTRIHSELDDAE